MPELPEVECIRQAIEPHLLGQRVQATTLFRPDICTRSTPRVAYPKALLVGGVITGTLRHGKQFALVADDGRTLCIHLGMSGQVLLNPSATLSHVHALWTIGHPPLRLVFRDPRRFGGLWTYQSPDDLRRDRWSALGPDALTINTEALRDALATTSRPIKAALLDQALIAGVGNIYADEALFRARVSPLHPGHSLAPDHVAALAESIRGVLAAAITARGSTLRDYRNADGSRGQAATLHHVYARRGLPCTRCGKPLIGALVAQRSTVWCPGCQPR